MFNGFHPEDPNALASFHRTNLRFFILKVMERGTFCCELDFMRSMQSKKEKFVNMQISFIFTFVNYSKNVSSLLQDLYC